MDEPGILIDETGRSPPPRVGLVEYQAALRALDAAVCEALAVGQAASGRIAVPRIGYGTHVFAQICSHATSFVRAAPRSRWVSSDHEWWDFSIVAGHARSIIEGYLLFAQLVRAPVDPGESEARIDVMHLNDCTKRVGVLEITEHENVGWFHDRAEEIRGRLRLNPYFSALPAVQQSRLLSGRYLTIQTRDEQLDALGWDKVHYSLLWDVLSQYTHVLPFSFYSIEPNGRSTGLPNDVDRGYMTMAMAQCSTVLVSATDAMVGFFPDAAPVRQGVDSKFSPGPRRNLPRHRKRGSGR